MPHRLSRTARRLFQQPIRALLLILGLALVSGCGEPADRQQTSSELLLVYSGDFRGFFEPCG
jgi:hypothetical protein